MMRWWTLLVTVCTAFNGVAAEPPPINDLGKFVEIPILSEGRKMPLDSFARHTLLRYSGKAKRPDADAVDWLARVLFTPASTREDAVFLVNNPAVAHAMGIPPKDDRLYAFPDLEPGLEALAELARQAQAKEDADRDEVDREVLRVEANTAHYIMLANVFAWTRPHEDFELTDAGAKQRLGLPEAATLFSFAEIHAVRDQLQQGFEALDPDNISSWSPTEQSLYRLHQALQAWGRQVDTSSFMLVPVAAHTGEETWMSPADALGWGFPDQQMIEAIRQLRSLSTAYVLRDAEGFEKAVDQWMAYVIDRKGSDPEVRKRAGEVAYNRLRPFMKSLVAYIPAFLLGLLAVVFRSRGLRWAGLALLLLGLVFHTTGIGWRIWLTARPPVTNLYGSFLFVGAVVALLGVLAEARTRNGIGVFTGALGALVLLLVAQRFEAEGDTLAKVVAVLDSNFWLATHVIAITVGYAGVWLAGVVGHVWLVARWWRRGDREFMESIRQPMMGLLAFGWCFSFLGTMLGGVWADQSWGRFWGWDPKENGALLIVIWVAALYHAKLAGLIKDRGMAAGTVIGCVIVMLAWLGVNLMGVGLHSYGFTSGLARGLLAYVVAELLFLGVVYGWDGRKKQVNP